MFDLFRRRNTIVRYFLGGILGLVALSMVITLVPGFGTPSMPREQLVAEIAGEPLTVREVQNTIQAALNNRTIPPDLVDIYAPQIIDQLIAERALAYQARRMGFRVSEQELANQIRTALAPLFPSGEFDRQAYMRFLAERNMSISDFERMMERSLLAGKLESLIREAVVVTPQELEEEFHRKNDKLKIEYIVFKPEVDRSKIAISREEMLDYFNKNRAQFQDPETRTFEVLIADQEKFAQTVQVTEAELRAYYSRVQDRYRTPDRAQARHILIMTMGKPKEELPKLEAKAQDVLKQVKAGGNFAELAKKYSHDPGSRDKGGDLGWVTRNGQMVKEFEDAVFALKPGEISGLVKTSYGFHIVQTLTKEPARVRPFEEVRSELAEELKKQRVTDQLQNAIEQARAALEKSPKNAAQIAAQYGLMYVKAENLASGAAIPEVGNSAELTSAVFSARVNEVTPVIQVSPTRLAVAVVNAIHPPKPSEFAAVEGRIREELITARVNEITQKRLTEIENKMKAAGQDFDGIAKSLNLTKKVSNAETLAGAFEGLGPVSYFAAGFQRGPGAVLPPVRIGDQLVLARVVEIQKADVSQLANERANLLSELKARKARMRRELFEDGLVNELTKEGKIKRYPEAIQRIANSFRRA